MAKCDSKGFVIRKEQMGKYKDQDVIALSVTEDLASCAKIDARTIDTSGLKNLKDGTSLYNAANVPEDEFGCSKNKCANTGTYQGAVKDVGDGEVIIGDFKKTMDGNLYLTGLVTAYILLPDGNHKVTLEITEYTEAAWKNSNKTSVTVHATKGGGGSALYPVVFDLKKLDEPGGTVGSGWTSASVGVKVRFHIEQTHLAADKLVGVSSIAFYESTEDLEINKVILLTCVDTAGDETSYDIVEGACAQSEYNTQSGTVTGSFSFNGWTKNFEYLFPTYHTTEETEFGIPHIVTRKVVAGTGELEGYGTIQISDMIDGDCGFIYIQTPGCANNSSELTRISSPVPVTLGSDKFQVLSTSYNGDKNMGTILVDKQWVGQELNVIYRQKKTAEISQYTNEFRDITVNIMVPFRHKDGTMVYHYYENVLITNNAHNISRTDENARELNFTAAADENGVRYKIVRPLD